MEECHDGCSDIGFITGRNVQPVSALDAIMHHRVNAATNPFLTTSRTGW